MHSRGLLITALGLLAVGFLGLALVPYALLGGRRAVGQATSGFTSLGQQIYYTGTDAARPIPRTIAGWGMMGGGMMGQVACVNCHGEDGRGGPLPTMMFFGTLDIPDIRYSVLTNPRSQDGTTLPAWTDADIARAIRDGVEPTGQRLKAPMPRWDMTDADLRETIAYLKELKAP
jgi:cytochrome c oxidase subunit 2